MTKSNEVHARIAAMNRMSYLGMAKSVRVGTLRPEKWGKWGSPPGMILCTNAMQINANPVAHTLLMGRIGSFLMLERAIELGSFFPYSAAY
jgi:hypothetical protein